MFGKKKAKSKASTGLHSRAASLGNIHQTWTLPRGRKNTEASFGNRSFDDMITPTNSNNRIYLLNGPIRPAPLPPKTKTISLMDFSTENDGALYRPSEIKDVAPPIPSSPRPLVPGLRFSRSLSKPPIIEETIYESAQHIISDEVQNPPVPPSIMTIPSPKPPVPPSIMTIPSPKPPAPPPTLPPPSKPAVSLPIPPLPPKIIPKSSPLSPHDNSIELYCDLDSAQSPYRCTSEIQDESDDIYTEMFSPFQTEQNEEEEEDGVQEEEYMPMATANKHLPSVSKSTIISDFRSQTPKKTDPLPPLPLPLQSLSFKNIYTRISKQKPPSPKIPNFPTHHDDSLYDTINNS